MDWTTTVERDVLTAEPQFSPNFLSLSSGSLIICACYPNDEYRSVKNKLIRFVEMCFFPLPSFSLSLPSIHRRFVTNILECIEFFRSGIFTLISSFFLSFFLSLSPEDRRANRVWNAPTGFAYMQIRRRRRLQRPKTTGTKLREEAASKPGAAFWRFGGDVRAFFYRFQVSKSQRRRRSFPSHLLRSLSSIREKKLPPSIGFLFPNTVCLQGEAKSKNFN